jgi:hypothetical protein
MPITTMGMVAVEEMALTIPITTRIVTKIIKVAGIAVMRMETRTIAITTIIISRTSGHRNGIDN